MNSDIMTNTLIVCIGSTVMQDDGVGYHILKYLQKLEIKADFADLGTDIFRLRLHFSNHKKIIIIDALMGEEPGKILSFTYPEFKTKLEGKIKNAHLLGVIEGIDIMRAVDDQLNAAEIYFVGVIAQIIDKGFELTKIVKEAVPQAAQKVVSLI